MNYHHFFYFHYQHKNLTKKNKQIFKPLIEAEFKRLRSKSISFFLSSLTTKINKGCSLNKNYREINTVIILYKKLVTDSHLSLLSQNLKQISKFY